jgi:hypothetical protein
MNRMVGMLALVLGAYTVFMMMSGVPKEIPGSEIREHGITLQLASDSTELRSLLNRSDYDVKSFWLHHTHLDNFYIPIYAAFFLGFIWMMGGGGTEATHRLAWVACLTIAVAAVADGFENYHIFAALGASTIDDDTVAAIRNPSHIKWFSTAFTMGLIAILLFQQRPRPFGKFNPVLAGVAALASVVGFCGFLDRRLFGLSLLISLPIGLACIWLLWLKKQNES